MLARTGVNLDDLTLTSLTIRPAAIPHGMHLAPRDYKPATVTGLISGFGVLGSAGGWYSAVAPPGWARTRPFVQTAAGTVQVRSSEQPRLLDVEWLVGAVISLSMLVEQRRNAPTRRQRGGAQQTEKQGGMPLPTAFRALVLVHQHTTAASDTRLELARIGTARIIEGLQAELDEAERRREEMSYELLGRRPRSGGWRYVAADSFDRLQPTFISQRAKELERIRLLRGPS